MRCKCGYGWPHENTVAHYCPKWTWKRGPIPKSCAECHDTIGYHRPGCSRPEPVYETPQTLLAEVTALLKVAP